jgi:ribosomal protein S27AE
MIGEKGGQMICPKCKSDTLSEERDRVVCSKCGFDSTLLEYNAWKKVYEAKPRLFTFQRFLKSMFNSTSSPSRETANTIRKGFECPKCGRSMLRGYLVSSGRIVWSDNISLVTNPLDQFWLRTRGVPMFHQPFGLEAYRCRVCGIIYIDEFEYFG